jgi:hypothetical protein
MKLINELKRLNEACRSAKAELSKARRDLHQMRNSIVENHCPVKLGEMLPFDDGRKGSICSIDLNYVKGDRLYFNASCVMDDDSVETMTIVKIDK